VDDGLPRFAADVLDVVDSIPQGRVLTYGDVAELLGEGGPRSVARVMSTFGGSVPWWRVLRADGTPAPVVAERAMAAYRAEGTPLRAGGSRVDLWAARWDGVPPGAASLSRAEPGGSPSR
jgi:alkylated DNA nucleotide flippase Atl1